jgi:hypothetical protein
MLAVGVSSDAVENLCLFDCRTVSLFAKFSPFRSQLFLFDAKAGVIDS